MERALTAGRWGPDWSVLTCHACQAFPIELGVWDGADGMWDGQDECSPSIPQKYGAPRRPTRGERCTWLTVSLQRVWRYGCNASTSTGFGL